MTIKVSRRSKRAREAVGDIDYADKLSDAEAAWLETFVRATAANSTEDMSALVGEDPARLAKLQKEIFDEDHARRRDITYVGQQVELSDDISALAAPGSLEFGQLTRCGRCLNAQCECGPRFRLNAYDQSDYLPSERNEDTVIGEVELARRMAAFDLLPYGDSPEGLQQGHAVKVCLPFHLLDKALGYVLMFRPVSGEYLVRSMSKRGLNDKDGKRPPATVLYCKPDALQRSKPELVKAFSPSTDK